LARGETDPGICFAPLLLTCLDQLNALGVFREAAASPARTIEGVFS
jgi:hypothetical protein